MEDLIKMIRDIPDFPKKGIVFKDITTLLGDAKSFKKVVDLFIDRYKDKNIDVVVGIEARGFFLAGPLAYILNAGLVPVRKPGKLPYLTNKISYDLEYGTNTVEIHQDAISSGQRVLIVDDLLATGGTMEAAAHLVSDFKAEIVELAFIIDLSFLNGREKLKDYNIFSLIKF